jgi:hypothetical protein
VSTIPFAQVPLVVKIAVGVAFFNAWVSIEEFVIDRVGLWKFMPYYKVGEACVWDLGVASLIVLAIWRGSRRGKSQDPALQRG